MIRLCMYCVVLLCFVCLFFFCSVALQEHRKPEGANLSHYIYNSSPTCTVDSAFPQFLLACGVNHSAGLPFLSLWAQLYVFQKTVFGCLGRSLFIVPSYHFWKQSSMCVFVFLTGLSLYGFGIHSRFLT